MSQVIVITGMGRSGTSLVSSLLQKAGVHVGDQLLPPYPDNPRGYFEDVEFYEFHENALHSRHQTYLYVDDSFTFEPTSGEMERAQELIAKRVDRPVWGWKDPRTTLFLPFWHRLLPHARFLFLYRHPLEVLLSLLRRGEFDNHPHVAAGLQAWQIFNRSVITFYEQHPAQCLLVHIDGLVTQLEAFAKQLQHKLQMDVRLNSQVFDEIYHAEELKKTPLTPEVTRILAKVNPGLLELYNRLNAQADLPPVMLESAPIASPPVSALARFIVDLPEPISLPLGHSLLQLLLSLLAPQATETMLTRFHHNVKGAQRTVELLNMKMQRLERTNAEQAAVLQMQTTQLEAQQAELRQIHATRTWRLVQSCATLKEKWQKKAG